MFDQLVTNNWDVIDENHGKGVAETLFEQEVQRLEELLLDYDWNIEQNTIMGGGGKTLQAIHYNKMFDDEGWAEETVTIKKRASFKTGMPYREWEFATHKIDHCMVNDEHKLCMLEIEWNNKDPFLDRDFAAFTSLYNDGIIELAIFITRGSTMTPDNFVGRVRQYFADYGVTAINDFDRLGNDRFIIDGKKRFTFPTERHQEDIEAKIGAGQELLDAAANVFVGSKYGTTTTSWPNLQRRITSTSANRLPVIYIGIPDSVFD
jgi:hypothetical protein